MHDDEIKGDEELEEGDVLDPESDDELDDLDELDDDAFEEEPEEEAL